MEEEEEEEEAPHGVPVQRNTSRCTNETRRCFRVIAVDQCNSGALMRKHGRCTGQ